MKKEILATSAILGIGAVALVLSTRKKPLKTVSNVNLEKYLGKWYEIAAFPQSFEKGCACNTAEYNLMDDGRIEVKNTCIKDGKIKTVKGIASVDDKKTNSKLDISFLWPFSGKYWVIALAHDYSYAVVGHPNRKYLWILNRKPKMDNMTYNHLVLMAAGKGFDIRKLVKTVQECEEEVYA